MTIEGEPVVSNQPPPADEFAEHGRFVRNLAWRLLHDEDAAEEVVQETMLAVVKAKPARDRSLKPWLATVARNVIRRRFRGQGRRRKREEAAAKPEALPATVDMLARAEMLREVVDAVLSLEEPNKSTVLLRYYEDLPPREIAKRQGVGVETVRGRLKRAAKQLRRRLDARHPEGRAGWAPLLAGLCGIELPAHLLGGSTGVVTGSEVASTAQAPLVVVGGIQGVAAAFLVGAVVAGGASWWGLAPSTTSYEAATVVADPLRREATRADAVQLRGRADAERRLAAARARRLTLNATLAALQNQVASLEPKPADPRAFHFALPEETPAFDAADWETLAGHMLGLSRLLRDVRHEVITDRQPASKTVREMLEHNQPLSVFAIAIQPEMEATDPNTAYSHPAVLANLIRAALALGVGVSEVVVTPRGAERLTGVEDLSGHEVVVRRSSSYYESLERLNQRLNAEGSPPVELTLAEEHLEDEELLEMVNAGLIPAVVVDSHKARFWEQIFDGIELHPEAAVATDREIAWAMRKDSPRLRERIDDFLVKHRKGTLMGNILFKKYLRSTRWVERSLSQESTRRFEETVALFHKYAEVYDFDWLMLVALAYQESRLEQDLRSGAGAVGVMQILPSTAADPQVGVADIHLLENNIEAGTKYLRFLRSRYFDDPELDEANKTYFTFAAYNAGPRRITQLRQEAAREGLDPNVWFDNVEVVAARRIGRETVQYVSNISKYHLAYSRIAEERAGKKPPLAAAPR